MKQLLAIAILLAIYTSTTISKYKPLPNSRLGLRCYNDHQKLAVQNSSDSKIAHCTDQYGNPIARPQLYDLRNNQTVLFGPGSMHESLGSGGSIRVAEISCHGMRVSCSPGYKVDISQQRHLSCVRH